LVIHYQSQAKLRDRDVVLQRQNEQLAQLTAENAGLYTICRSTPRKISHEL
jgi:hypothetical protein